MNDKLQIEKLIPVYSKFGTFYAERIGKQVDPTKLKLYDSNFHYLSYIEFESVVRKSEEEKISVLQAWENMLINYCRCKNVLDFLQCLNIHCNCGITDKEIKNNEFNQLGKFEFTIID